MTWQDPSFWEIVLDIIALCLCAIAVVTLLRQRKTGSRRTEADDPKPFAEVLEDVPVKTMGCADEPEISFRFGESGSMRTGCGTDDRYHQVESMADSGLSAEEITRRIHVPKGEVELVMKLKHQAEELAAKAREKGVAAG